MGTGVLPIYPRHPVLLAQEALTLQEVSGGRLRLGIGVSHRPMMEGALGLDMGRPLEVVREYVAVLRQALTGRVEHAGPRYRVAWQSGVPRLPAPPPIYLAGLGTAMLELAGEIADGAVLWLCAPAYIREHAVPAIRRGRERAGKALDGFEIVASVPAAVTADRVAAAAAFKSELGRYLALPFYRAMLEKSGFGAEVAAWNAAPGPAAVDDRLAQWSGRRRRRRDAPGLHGGLSRGRRHAAGHPPHRFSRTHPTTCPRSRPARLSDLRINFSGGNMGGAFSSSHNLE